jgi:hypothetical protein
VDLRENAKGLKQYAAIVQFDFFASSSKKTYRLMLDKLAQMYDENVRWVGDFCILRHYSKYWTRKEMW